ncbi:MAG: Bro-N domain-containing protein [Bacteroidaceae bacterium]|nr:Bro-N domain-containing protein [Bacteroidaceae bacterium]
MFGLLMLLCIIRTMSDEQGEPLFCGKDVCDALGYTNPQKALRPCRQSR